MNHTQHGMKALEYAFVQQMSGAGAMNLFSPSSVSTQDGAQDFIFQSHAKLLLVEFRPQPLDVEIEGGKYDDFDMVKKLLGVFGRHHLLIHGQFDGDLLTLHCQPYFEGRADGPTKLVDIGKHKAAEQLEFKKYVLQLLALRKRDPQRGGVIDIDEHASVLAVSSHQVIVAACSLRDYVGKVFPAFVTELPSAVQEFGSNG